MIRKPAEGWGQESPAIGAMRNAAAGGKAVVQTGGRMIRGGYLCFLGGIFLLGALAGGAGGSMPTLIGGGAVGGLILAAGLKALKRPAAVEPSFATAAFAPANASSTVEYSRGKLLAQAGFAAVFLVICLAGLGQVGGMLRLLATVMIPIAGMLAVCSARKAFGDLTALRWDSSGVTVTGLLKSHTVPWSSVESVGLEQLNTYAYGIVKVASHRILTVRRADRAIGKRLSLTVPMLDLGARSPDALVAALQAASQGRPAAFAERPAAFGAPPADAAAPFAPAAPLAATPRPAARAEPPMRPVAYGGPAAYSAAAPRATFGRRGL